MQEPAIRGLIVLTVFSSVCCLIAAGLFFWGRRKNSTALKVMAIIPLFPVLLVITLVLILFVMDLWDWMFLNKATATHDPQSPPAITNYVR